jgi:hypothetical protein
LLAVEVVEAVELLLIPLLVLLEVAVVLVAIAHLSLEKTQVRVQALKLRFP